MKRPFSLDDFVGTNGVILMRGFYIVNDEYDPSEANLCVVIDEEGKIVEEITGLEIVQDKEAQVVFIGDQYHQPTPLQSLGSESLLQSLGSEPLLQSLGSEPLLEL